MRTFQSQSRSGASSSPHSLSSTASGTLTALLILTIPVCTCAPAELQQAITDQRQLLSQIDAVCSSYLSADLKILVILFCLFLCSFLHVYYKVKVLIYYILTATFSFWNQESDVLEELCVLMLFRKSKEMKVQEKSKRGEAQGPGGIQSRGYFLYRPRNGRRSLEYE
ncbi:neuromedin-U isoform X1 [Eleginops maclovinus]|uniref:neuromedin-U isoform X1 n=1 Tax=Eleginops maclovinus TaxID=56733 RepID=UPI0030802807